MIINYIYNNSYNNNYNNFILLINLLFLINFTL